MLKSGKCKFLTAFKIIYENASEKEGAPFYRSLILGTPVILT